jgi:hypothetical protein
VTDRALGVPAPGELAFHELDLPPVTDGLLRVETLFTGLSAGTELTYLKGTNPALHARWDAELGVFRADAPAEGYPVRKLGYMEVGRVAASAAPGFAEGELVAMTYGHATAHVADPLRERVVPVPADLDPVLGIYVAHMGPICANGLLHAAAELAPGPSPQLGDGVRGRLVLVTGAGVVGLLCGLWAKHLGAAEVAVADPSPRRLAAAAALGLTPVDDPEPWRPLKARWRHGPGDRGADVVLQCRGQVDALAAALRCLRPQGAAIELAFHTGGADALRLGEEFHHAGPDPAQRADRPGPAGPGPRVGPRAALARDGRAAPRPRRARPHAPDRGGRRRVRRRPRAHAGRRRTRARGPAGGVRGALTRRATSA